MNLPDSSNHTLRSISPSANLMHKCFNLQTPVVDFNLDIAKVGWVKFLDGVGDQQTLQSILEEVRALNPGQ
jgi:hypothetical protein